MENKTPLAKMPVKDFFSDNRIKSKVDELMGKRSTQFITSVLQIVNSNDLLKEASPMSIYTAAMTAATLDLPINNQLGFAYIVPYKSRERGTEAQFQIGYKGMIQLALRSGQFKTISVTEVYDGQLIDENPLTGFVFDWKNKKSNDVIGYAAYFSLINGFEKTLYASKEQVQAHSLKFSQTAKKGFGVWKDDFDSMAKKTVLKMLISKYAPLSVEMQRAVISDQAVILDVDSQDVTYPDNAAEKIDKEEERVKALIEDCGSDLEKLNALAEDVRQNAPDYLHLVVDEIALKS
jgi:recombination protein RecT